MKERQIGGKILKSAIAILLAAAVAVLTLPGFKMDVRAIADEPESYDYNTCPGYDGADGYIHAVTKNEYIRSSGSIKSGETLFVYGDPDNPGQYDAIVSGLDSVASRTQYGMGVLFTFTSNANVTISGNNFTFTKGADDASSAEEPAKPGAVKGDPEAMARAAADMIAKYNAEQERIRQQREEYRIYQAKLLQSQIDNEYFRNQNELKANGKSMVVRPDHSAVKSTVNGNYHATYTNGFAAVALDPLAAPNLFVETWDITSKKSDKAFNSINDWVNEKGGTLIGAVQVNIGTKNGKGEVVYESENKDPVANAKFGVPNDGAKYVIVQVLPGGGTNVFENLAIENGVATLPLPIGQAAYGVVKLPQ